MKERDTLVEIAEYRPSPRKTIRKRDAVKIQFKPKGKHWAGTVMRILADPETQEVREVEVYSEKGGIRTLTPEKVLWTRQVRED